MPSVDFNWQEGDDAFTAKAEEFQPPPPPPETFARPASPSSEQTLLERAERPSLFRASNLILLVVGIALGIGVGFGILTVQGQRNARADLAPVVELQYQALAQNDRDLYNNLIDPEDQAWRELLAGAFPVSSLLYDFEAGPPRVTSVELAGNRAEVEIDSLYDGEHYRRWESMRLVDGQWRFTRSAPQDWGELQTATGEHTVLHYRERDAFVADLLPHIDAVVQTFCDRYAAPPPCQLDLSIEPDPNLLPFIPGAGASPLPPLVDYIIMSQGSTGYVTINGTGEEIRSVPFRNELLARIGFEGEINQIYAAQSASPEDRAISDARLHQDTMPLQIVSPRLVGLHGDESHPLWWLALHEAIGDVVLRRALGPITAPKEAAFTAWAIARGDVALWAERLSGVRLPETPIDVHDAASVGEALLKDDASQRNAARSLALFLAYRDSGGAGETLAGELATLAFLQSAGDAWDAETMFDVFDLTPRRLSDAWTTWLQERR